jgi:hypothetical protein
VGGKITRKPLALAFAHIAASLRICECNREVEGLSHSNTQALRCFHNIQAISSVVDARPLRMGFGVVCLAVSHHSFREAS